MLPLVLCTPFLVGMASHLNSDMSNFDWAITGRPDPVLRHTPEIDRLPSRNLNVRPRREGPLMGRWKAVEGRELILARDPC